MQYTEQDICAGLDGSFRRVDRFGEFVTDTVPKSFIPSHRAPKVGAVKGVKRPSYRHWTPAEDELLIHRRAHGLNIIEVGRVLGRSEDSMRHRVKTLREQGVRV
jgi:hypothetical protein